MAAVKLNDNQTRIVNALFDGPKTINEIGGVANQSLVNMEQAGVIRRLKGTVKHTDENGEPKRGRPMTIWSLTQAQRNRVTAQRKQAAKA